jgi:hypothetical protein
MSGASPPIISAPVPPSIEGIAQPVIVSGGESLPPSLPEGTEFTSPGWGWLPLPQVGMGENEPFPTLVVEPADVPPSVAGYPQPQFASGDAATPTADSLFPAFTSPGPNPPIIYSAAQPPPPVPLPLPTTPGMGPISLSVGPRIPQIPWYTSAAPDEPAPQPLGSDVPPPHKRSHHTKRRARH